MNSTLKQFIQKHSLLMFVLGVITFMWIVFITVVSAVAGAVIGLTWAMEHML